MRRNIVSTIKRISPPIFGLVFLVAIGTFLFSYMEGIPLFDAFYWTIVVISTVGFGDITPQTPGGKILFIILVIFGLAFFGYFLSLISSMVTEEKLSRILYGYLFPDGEKMKDHVLIIGWSELSRYICQELSANGINYLIIVDDESLHKKLNMEGYRSIVGNIEDEDFIERVGLSRAKSVVISSLDTSTVIIDILRVRKHNKSVPVIALCSQSELSEVMMEAGATYVVNGYDIVGRLMANYVFEPHAAYAAMDLLSRGHLDLTEVTVGSKMDGKPIGELIDSVIKSKIVLIKRGNRLIPNPGLRQKIHKGDILVLFGLSEDLESDSEILRE